MADLTLAFRDFLLRDAPMNDPVREAGAADERDGGDPGGRQAIRNIVGWRIFDGREHRGPAKGVSGAVAITLEASSELTWGTVSAPAPIVAPFVDISVWARDTDEISGAERARKLHSALRQYLSQYQGPLNDDVDTQTIKHEAGPNQITIRPSDASGNWTYRYLSTWMLGIAIEMPTGAN